MKREALNHTKMKRLCRRLNLPLWQGVGLLESLWQLTARETERGNIGKLSNEEIAIGIDYRDDENLMIEALLSCGWLDPHPIHRLLIHDWPEHADDYVQMRLARKHMTFASGTVPRSTRLAKTERSFPDDMYGNSQSENVNNMDSVRTKQESVRTPSAQNCDLCAQNADPCAPPEPKPEPKPIPEPIPEPPPPLTPPPKNGAHGTEKRRRQYPELPKTRAEIAKNFEDVGEGFLHRLYLKSCASARKGGCDPKLVTDALLALTVRQCTKKHQESAGLYLDTVPSTIQTWAETEEK